MPQQQMPPEGDPAFAGVNSRLNPAQLSPGFLSEGLNIRCRYGEVETRLGVVKPIWGNIVNNRAVTPSTLMCGSGRFSDPNGLEHMIRATDGQVYRMRPFTAPTAITLPEGVTIITPVTFTQAFDKLFMFRGKGVLPLVLNDLDTGFEDLVTEWDDNSIYNGATGGTPVGGLQADTPASEVAYGPYQSIASLTGMGNTATAVTATAHNYVTGQSIRIQGSDYEEYNGRATITVIDQVTFTYPFPGSTHATATGTITASAMRSYWRAQGKTVTPLSITHSGATATATAAGHGFSNGDYVTMSGATGADASLYNGTYPIENVTANAFDYVMTDTPAADATGIFSALNLNIPKGEPPLGLTVTITSLTHSTTTATATATAHGFATGNKVTIPNANLPHYNGTFTITVVDANTFTYTMAADPGANATGSTTAFNNSIAAKDDQTSTTANWLQIYTILPPAENAVYVQDRLMIPTAYDPTTGTEGKADFVVATDVLDYLHFDFPDEFRINQGSADSLVALAKMNDTTIVAFKDHSISLLTGVALDLSGIANQTLTTEYGLSGPKAVAVVGSDVVFLADRRGVVSLRQTELNQVQGVDLPLSDQVQDLMARINWTLADKAAFAYWDNKLYMAVPLDNGTNLGRNLIPLGATYEPPQQTGSGHHVINPPPVYAVTGLTVGQRYHLALNGDNAYLTCGTQIISFDRDFTATDTTALLTNNLTADFGNPVKATLQQSYENVNNAVLIYDFLTGQFSGRGAASAVSASLAWAYGDTRGNWSGYDTGSAIMVRDWFKGTLNGQERLFYLSEDGFVNLYEEADCGDQIYDPTQPGGLGWEEIATEWTTRGYTFGTRKYKRFPDLDMMLQTWNPNYTITQITEGVSEQAELVTNRTKDRTVYDRPFDAQPWDPTNSNDDHATPYRQDYSVPVGNDGLQLGSGIVPDLFQEFPENLKGTRMAGSFVQYRVRNIQGRIKMTSVMPSAVMGEDRRGSHS
jgi:hypothetical protein